MTVHAVISLNRAKASHEHSGRGHSAGRHALDLWLPITTATPSMLEVPR